MTPRLTHLTVLTAAVIALLACSPLARAAGQLPPLVPIGPLVPAEAPVSLGEAYSQIKSAERGIPIPTPVATVDMGTFNAATGEFDGLATETEIINHKPVRIVPQVSVNAVNARLVFTIIPSTTSVTVSVTGGGSALVTKGKTSIEVSAGRLTDVKWRIAAGTKSHSDQLTVNRPRIIGAGAFTIPALPVGIVYDPPQDPAGTNSVKYTRSTSVGTTIGLTVKSASGTSTPGVNPEFSEVGIFHSQLQGAIDFASVTGNSATANGLKLIDKYLGKATRNVSDSSDTTTSSKRTYTFTEAHTCSTDTGVFHLGPGHGDRIAYLRNARLVWLYNGTTTFAQLLGYDSYECPTIDQLRSGVAGLSTAAAEPLIALDPFTGPLGPKALLGADPRFSMLPGIGLLPGLVVTATYQQQLLIEQSASETSTHVVTDDLGAGLLSLVGLAPSQTQSVSSTLSVNNVATTTESTTVTTELTARTLVSGIRTELAVFYDRVFGNIAFQDPRP